MTRPGVRPCLGTTRRGFTLIEMLAVMTCLAIMMGLCAVTIQVLLRTGADAQERRSTTSALGRLAERFREDVHASDEAMVMASKDLRLARGSRPRVAIVYEVEDGRVARIESVDDTESRRESYLLGRGHTAAFEARDDGPRRFLALVVRREASPGHPDPASPLEVLALVGKDRLEAPRSKGGQPR
jgi:prepilin-type N-terminal cleavage/methylation domain-containing protein